MYDTYGLHHIPSNEMITVNYEPIKMWDGTVLAHFKVQHQNMLVETEENYKGT
jgi:hypothetical protein